MITALVVRMLPRMISEPWGLCVLIVNLDMPPSGRSTKLTRTWIPLHMSIGIPYSCQLQCSIKI
uniref:Uncharacterized protein n=1 Tax=Arundo donax TaxID=35708 RepID=A0A0A9B861_ARUDO